MPFQINSVQPPEGARPVGEGYRLHPAEPRGRSGLGKPVGAVGLTWAEISFDILNKTGWDWWVAQVGTGLSADKTNIETWNPWKSGGAGYTTYSTGVLHRPELGDIREGNYHGVRILMTELEE